jgi:hypothetical protein
VIASLGSLGSPALFATMDRSDGTRLFNPALTDMSLRTVAIVALMSPFSKRVRQDNSASSSAVWTLDRNAQVIVSPNAAELDICTYCGLGRCRCRGAAKLLYPSLGLCSLSVKNCNVVTGFGEMPGHPVAHDTQSDPCNLCHCAASPILDDISGQISRKKTVRSLAAPLVFS